MFLGMKYIFEFIRVNEFKSFDASIYLNHYIRYIAFHL